VIFRPLCIAGATVIELAPSADARGSFARTFCRQEFAANALRTDVTQCNLSRNIRRGTIRGMHYQIAPKEEAKLVLCTRGSLFDVVLDLRKGSSTFGRWEGVVLQGNRPDACMLYVPEGCAHGFQTLEDDTEIYYVMFGEYSADHARGVRWNDPAVKIAWPIENPTLSEKDRSLPTMDSSIR
jgi:dTDP-4-dehydrorhamnose 3,5-epimerase